MGVDDSGDADPAAGELLDDHRVGGQVQPHPPVLLGDRDPEQAQLLHLLHDRVGEAVLVVVVLGVGDDLLVGELADHLADRALLVGEVLGLGGYGHGYRQLLGRRSVSRGLPRIPARNNSVPIRPHPASAVGPCGSSCRDRTEISIEPGDRRARAGASTALVTRAQLVELGLGESAITSRCRRGRLFRVHSGVYSVGRPAPTPARARRCGGPGLRSRRHASATVQP